MQEAVAALDMELGRLAQEEDKDNGRCFGFFFLVTKPAGLGTGFALKGKDRLVNKK